VESTRHNGTLVIVRNEIAGRRDFAIVSPEVVEPAYVVVDGTSYNSEMSIECINALELCRRNNWLVHLHHGYIKKESDKKPVGLDWLEEFDCRGASAV
jgi:hypothetical protein